MAIDDLNSTINQLILIDIYRILHSEQQNTHSSQTQNIMSAPHLLFSFLSTLSLIFFCLVYVFLSLSFQSFSVHIFCFFVLLTNVLQSNFIFVLFQFEKQQVLASSLNSFIFFVLYNIFVAISTPLIWVFISSDLYLSLSFWIGEIVTRYFCFYLFFYFIRLEYILSILSFLMLKYNQYLTIVIKLKLI